MSKNTSPPKEQLPFVLRKKQVAKMLGLSEATIYKKQKAGVFPLPVKLGNRAIGWLTVDIQNWLAERAISK
jgi:prophage regulatory protein